MLHAVIMAGGSGTRFWPLSRQSHPKQLLNLTGNRTMIQQTVDRCLGLVQPEQFWIVTNETQAEPTADQLPDIPVAHILREPCARNTAPCVGLAAIHLLQQDPEATMLLMPADHVIETMEAFQQTISTAVDYVEQNPSHLALFGVVPTFPSTGYGYIERAESLQAAEQSTIFKVSSFREKPDHETATEYLKAGSFFWNCGIFVWKAQTILNMLAEHEPKIHEHLLQIQQGLGSEEADNLLKKHFPECPSISIDYAVLERADNIAVVEANFQWDDVGSWQALHRLRGKNEQGNTIVGLHAGIETTDCIIRSTEDHLVATLGVSNCIIVHTVDATYVANKGDENAIKQLIEELKVQNLEQYLS